MSVNQEGGATKGKTDLPTVAAERTGPFWRLPARFNLDDLQRDYFMKLSPSDRSRVEDQIRAYFGKLPTENEMFPDSSLLYQFGRSYHRVRTDEINSKFYGVDSDIRELLDVFQFLLCKNLLVRVGLRGVAQAIATVSIFVIGYLLASNFSVIPILPDILAKVTRFAVSSSPSSLDMPFLINLIAAAFAYSASFLLVGSGLLRIANLWIDDFYIPAVQTSCTVVDRNIFERLASLGYSLNQVSVTVRDLYDQSEDRWAKDSDYLMGLLVWIPQRSFHIESYFRLAMWKVRRYILYAQYVGVALSALVAIICVFVLYYFLPAHFVGEQSGIGVFSVFAAYLGIWSLRDPRATMMFVRHFFSIDRWYTFERIEMHRNLEGVVRFLISKFVMLRDIGKGGRL